MGSLGPFEIIAILLVVLLLFGAKRIPEIARGLGKGIREFKDATNEIKQELNVDPPRQQPPRQIHQSPQPAPPAQAQPSQPVATEASAPPPPAPESPADPQSQA
jgi:sec-independent protein translocase protein TatA